MTRKFPLQSQMLQTLRQEKDLTLRELSTETGINITKLFRLENGKAEMKVKELVALENFFNTEILEGIEDDYSTLPGLVLPTVRA